MRGHPCWRRASPATLCSLTRINSSCDRKHAQYMYVQWGLSQGRTCPGCMPFGSFMTSFGWKMKSPTCATAASQLYRSQRLPPAWRTSPGPGPQPTGLLASPTTALAAHHSRFVVTQLRAAAEGRSAGSDSLSRTSADLPLSVTHLVLAQDGCSALLATIFAVLVE